jgi:hypothetical protein
LVYDSFLALLKAKNFQVYKTKNNKNQKSKSSRMKKLLLAILALAAKTVLADPECGYDDCVANYPGAATDGDLCRGTYGPGQNCYNCVTDRLACNWYYCAENPVQEYVIDFEACGAT